MYYSLSILLYRSPWDLSYLTLPSNSWLFLSTILTPYYSSTILWPFPTFCCACRREHWKQKSLEDLKHTACAFPPQLGVSHLLVLLLLFILYYYHKYLIINCIRKLMCPFNIKLTRYKSQSRLRKILVFDGHDNLDYWFKKNFFHLSI